MHPHLYMNTQKLSPPTLYPSQDLGSNKSSSVHRCWRFGGFATPPYIHSHFWQQCSHVLWGSSYLLPIVCCLGGAVNQCFRLSSVHATQTTPKGSLSFCAKSKGRALQRRTPSCASGKKSISSCSPAAQNTSTSILRTVLLTFFDPTLHFLLLYN